MAAPDLPRLRAHRDALAALAVRNESYLPIFERLDRECEAAERGQADPVQAARERLRARVGA